jgi:hypothetical protein
MHLETALTMSAKYEMTWFKPRSCWYAKHDGRRYYCPIKCNGKTTDPANYRASVQWWRQKQSELAAVPIHRTSPWPPLEPEDRKKIKRLMGCPTHPQDEPSATQTVLAWKEQAADLHLYGPSDASRWLAMDRMRMEREAAAVNTRASVVEKFLNFKVNQAATGMKSAGRVINLVTYMKQFKAFVVPDRPVSDITAMTLFDYHGKTLRDIHASNLSDCGGRDRLQVAKQFIRWAWELNLLELPRNINSKELSIYIEPKEIKVFDPANLKALIDGAPEPLKVYLLLMANAA